MSDRFIRLPFTRDEADAAHAQWGCNCGPAALAAVLGVSLDTVRRATDAVGFGTRRYMSPTMMQQAIAKAGATYTANRIAGVLLQSMHFPRRGLARIQWEGPWTKPGANPKWAYHYTHWVASWVRDGVTKWDKAAAILDPVVFDINGGLMLLSEWESEVVPAITASIPRADGEWNVTHSWELNS